MLTRLLIQALMGVTVVSTADQLFAQEEGKSWLPRIFSSGGESASGKSTPSNKSGATEKTDNSTSWLPWRNDAKPKAKSARPVATMFNRMGQTTRRWWDNSLDFINPFDDAPKPKPNQGYKPQDEKKKSGGGGFFGWMTPQEDKDIRSVNDFLALPMPE